MELISSSDEEEEEEAGPSRKRTAGEAMLDAQVEAEENARIVLQAK